MTIQGGSPSGSRRTRKKKDKSAHLLLDFIAGWGYNSRVTDNGLVAQLGEQAGKFPSLRTGDVATMVGKRFAYMTLMGL